MNLKINPYKWYSIKKKDKRLRGNEQSHIDLQSTITSINIHVVTISGEEQGKEALFKISGWKLPNLTKKALTYASLNLKRIPGKMPREPHLVKGIHLWIKMQHNYTSEIKVKEHWPISLHASLAYCIMSECVDSSPALPGFQLTDNVQLGGNRQCFKQLWTCHHVQDPDWVPVAGLAPVTAGTCWVNQCVQRLAFCSFLSLSHTLSLPFK